MSVTTPASSLVRPTGVVRRATLCPIVVIALTLLLAHRADSQTTILRVWPGAAPGSEHWTQKEAVFENTPAGTIIQNVVTPTLTVFLPDRAKATGAGVIIAPGGYCVALAISSEGYDVARLLQKNGIAAFVLKYRTKEKKQDGIPKDLNMDEACKFGIADGIEALRVVRRHAAEWGVTPGKVGFMGFSAGGMVASGALLQTNAAARPDFAALIYGCPFGKMPPIPANLPPTFMAWAEDDTVARDTVVRFYEALISAGQHPDANLFTSGGHGFGVRKQNTPSDHWLEEFEEWLRAHKFTSSPELHSEPRAKKPSP
jgi:acetyl esterase/lipase